jgi:alkylation response protein AidB-like acyl-CoA dehydrogenase
MSVLEMLSADERLIVETVWEFTDKQVRPVARELEHANAYPGELIEAMKELGIFGLVIGEEYSGTAVSTPCFVLVTEELARAWMRLAGAMGGHTVIAKLIGGFGTLEQKQRWLPVMATGQVRAAMALTEPGGGSDLQAMRTIARHDASGYLVSGSKTWISNAPLRAHRPAVQDRPERQAEAQGHFHPARRARPRLL